MTIKYLLFMTAAALMGTMTAAYLGQKTIVQGGLLLSASLIGALVHEIVVIRRHERELEKIRRIEQKVRDKLNKGQIKW